MMEIFHFIVRYVGWPNSDSIYWFSKPIDWHSRFIFRNWYLFSKIETNFLTILTCPTTVDPSFLTSLIFFIYQFSQLLQHAIIFILLPPARHLIYDIKTSNPLLLNFNNTILFLKTGNTVNKFPSFHLHSFETRRCGKNFPRKKKELDRLFRNEMLLLKFRRSQQQLAIVSRKKTYKNGK